MLDFFHYNFIVNALIISVFCSITSAIIGTYITVKRKVLLSGGITHASFGGIGLAYFLGLNPLIGGAVFAVASAIGIELASNNKTLRDDSAIGMFWSLGMALGIIFIFLSPGYAPELTGYLFGNILTVNYFDIIISILLSVAIILLLLLKYHVILFVAYDENFAEARHINVKLLNLIMMIFVALTIVVNIKISGVVLVISMLCVVQSAINLFTHDFKKIIIYSFVFNLLSCILGIVISWWLNIPSGATIVFVLIIFAMIIKICSTNMRNKRLL